jgi:hypothetical protein
MKQLIYIFVLLYSINSIGQESSENMKFQIFINTFEKTSNDTIGSSIIEIYSGEKRIETAISDFDGNSILEINSKDIVDNKIILKVYGPKCRIFEEKYLITNNLNIKIHLEYGETEYFHHNQLYKMLKKLDIKLNILEMECGFEQPKLSPKN